MQTTLSDLETDEAAEVATHNNLIGTLDVAYDDMNSRKTVAEGELSDAKAEKITEEEKVTSTQTDIDNAQTLLDQHNKECEDLERIYNEETA